MVDIPLEGYNVDERLNNHSLVGHNTLGEDGKYRSAFTNKSPQKSTCDTLECVGP